jgi:hypothetical protein
LKSDRAALKSEERLASARMAKRRAAGQRIPKQGGGECEYTGTYGGIIPKQWELDDDSPEMYTMLPSEVVGLAKEARHHLDGAPSGGASVTPGTESAIIGRKDRAVA